MKTVYVIAGKKGVGKDTVGGMIREKMRCFNCSGLGWEYTYSQYMDSTEDICKECGGTGYNAKLFSFATPFKNFCVEALGIPSEWCFGESKERANKIDLRWEDLGDEIPKFGKTGSMTVRDALIVIGQGMRGIYPNVWANAAYVEAKKFFSTRHGTFILTDTRQPNEVEIFRNCKEAREGEWQVVTVRIYRKVPNPSTDYTETALDFMDWRPMQQELSNEDVGLPNPGFDHYIDNNGDLESLRRTVNFMIEEDSKAWSLKLK